ncbi:MAG: DUF3078 domain-containing protein, partial [Bacteroidales bacterium]|nr:DUF3078 domain-containing protein [Bacteroidales bacterium]
MMIRLTFLLLTFLAVCNIYAQPDLIMDAAAEDTTGAVPLLSTESALMYIQNATDNKTLWRFQDNSVKSALERLLLHTDEPFDSVRIRLAEMDFQSVNVMDRNVLIRDSLHVRWLNDSTFINDSLGWSLDLLLKEESRISYPVDLSTLILSDSILDENGMLDSALFTPDTLFFTVIDTAALNALEVQMHSYSDGIISPSLDDPEFRRSASISSDSSMLVISDTLSIWMAGDDTPFHFLTGKYQLDSIQYAVEALLAYSERRDSTMILINDMYGKSTPLWITTGTNESRRFWVKNYKNDSITLWIGNPGSGEISLLLEDDIDFNRLTKEELGHLPLTIPEPVRKLAKMEMLKADPVFWEYEVSNAFSFNQTYLSNWAKGGENSLTTMLDITGNATYNNTNA